MSQNEQELPALPTLEQAQSALTQLVVQRAALTDQLEEIEKKMAVVNSQVQLLALQKAHADKAEAAAKEALKETE